MQRRHVLAAPIALAGAAAAAPARAAEGAFKAVYLVKRREDFTFDAFRAYQFETHVPLSLALPGLRRYELDFFPPAADGTGQPHDAMASVWFDDRAAHDAALGSPEGQAALADLPNFLDTGRTVVLFGETAVAETSGA